MMYGTRNIRRKTMTLTTKPSLPTSLRSIDNRSRIQYDPEWSSKVPYQTYINGSAEMAFETLQQAILYCSPCNFNKIAVNKFMNAITKYNYIMRHNGKVTVEELKLLSCNYPTE